MRHRNVYVALINLSFPATVKLTIISQPKGPSKGLTLNVIHPPPGLRSRV